MNKGFTLVELLAVIIILGILTLITVISINPILKDSKEGLTDIQIDNIKESANLYYVKHGIGVDDYELDNPRYCINVSELIESGYIDSDEVTNPKTGAEILGSVKITYKSNNYIYEYQDNACTNYDRGIICEAVTEETKTSGNVPKGNFEPQDEYICEVKPGVKYNFFVVSSEKYKINLILDSNIDSQGNSIKESSSSATTVWLDKSGYLQSGGNEASWEENVVYYGPLSALNYLEKATSSWEYLNKITIDPSYSDNYFIKKYNLYARLPYLTEVDIVSNKTLWLINYLDGELDEFFDISGRTSVDDLTGYWTFDFGSERNAYMVNGVEAQKVALHLELSSVGVRPVISVYKFQME